MNGLLETLLAFWNRIFADGEKSSGPWPENLPLLELGRSGFWGRANIWRLGHACLSVVFLGTPGSGKSSALRYWVSCLLKIRAGCCLLVYKKETTEEFLEAVKRAGRLRDVILVRPSGSSNEAPKHSTNILTYELKRCGEHGAVDEILFVLEQVTRTLSGQNSEKTDEWRAMALRLLRYVLHIQIAAYAAIDLLELNALINDLPTCRNEVEERTFQPALRKALDQAERRSGTTHAYELRLVKQYLIEWADLAPKTRASIITTLKTFMDRLLSPTLYSLLFSPKPTFWPSAVLDGSLIALDYPADSGETARMAGLLLKETIYRTIQSRTEEKTHRRPIAVIVDELQKFASPQDAEMSNVGRSYRLVFLGATQNIPSLAMALNSGEAQAQVNGFISNLQTKVVTLTADPTTCTHLSDALGKIKKRLKSGSRSVSMGPDGNVTVNETTGYSETLAYRVEPGDWQTLRAGGRENNLWVDAVLMGTFTGGKLFKNGRRYLKVRFDQTMKNRRGSVRVIAPRITA